MNFFTLFSEKKVRPAPGTKIIPAKEFSSLKKASELLKTVKSEALTYKKELVKECELLKQQGYTQGFEEGLEKLNETILKLDLEINKFEEEMKTKVLPIALKAAKKIIGRELELYPERILDIVMQTLKPVTQHHKIKIYVNKEDLLHLEKHKEKIKQLLPQVKIFSLEERDDINPGGCIIETEVGIINAQLDNQFRALEAAFEKFMKK